MEIEITEKKNNALLGRTEVRFRISHMGEATPTRDNVREKLAGLLNSKKGLIVVDEMHSTFGQGITKGYARAYTDTKVLGDVEPDHILKRNKLEDLKPKKKAPAAK